MLIDPHPSQQHAFLVLCFNAQFRTFFSLFSSFQQCLDSNLRPLLMELTAMPAEPQPLPLSPYFCFFPMFRSNIYFWFPVLAIPLNLSQTSFLAFRNTLSQSTLSRYILLSPSLPASYISIYYSILYLALS